MAQQSKIQWTDATWNIARGCTKVDEDCKYCYMYRQSMDGTRYEPKQVIRTKTVFDLPLKLKEPSKIFTSSLTDVFHPDIDPYQEEMWDIIQRCPHHTFQILTKRPERIVDHLPEGWGRGWENVWIGTSFGSQDGAHDRFVDLIEIPAKVHFLSLEPLWAPIDMEKLTMGIPLDELGPRKSRFLDWVIVGGESGNDTGKYRYRPCQLEWIEMIAAQCQTAGIPVFVKQLGTHLAKELGLKDRNGGDINEWPEHLRIREFPAKRKGGPA